MRSPRNQGKKSRARQARAAPLGALPPGCKFTTTGLTLPSGLCFDRWQAIGQALAQRDSQLCWAIGDWWRYGMHKYGERKEMTEDPNWTGPSFSTCTNYARVAGKIKTSRRREVLSFKHHDVVAALPEEEADSLLQWYIEPAGRGRPRTVAELKEEMNRRDPRTIRVRTTILPREQPLSTGGQHITGRLGNIANVHEYAGRITQPEQASPTGLLVLPAPQQPQREADTQWAATRWATVIGALERAVAITVASADAKRFKEGLRAARELRGRYGS